MIFKNTLTRARDEFVTEIKIDGRYYLTFAMCCGFFVFVFLNLWTLYTRLLGHPWYFAEATPESLGQFGDYIGGILNPIVAFVAFIWLAYSVRIQKRELAETRVALEESHRAQQHLAEISLMAARIQGLNIRLTSIESRLSSLRDRQIQLLGIARDRGLEGEVPNPEGKYTFVSEQLEDIRKQIGEYEEAAKMQTLKIQEIEEVLSTNTNHTSPGENVVSSSAK